MDSGEVEHVRCWMEIDDDTLTALFQSASFGRGGALWMTFDETRFGEEFFALPVLRMWTHATLDLVRGSHSVAFETYGSGTLSLRRDATHLFVHRDRPFQARPEIGTGELVVTTTQLVSALLQAHRTLASQVYRAIPKRIRGDHAAWRSIQDDRARLKQAWQEAPRGS